MRQLTDMPSSLTSSILTHGGLLLVVFGIAAFVADQRPGMLTVALIGGVGLGCGIFFRKPSQRQAYRGYLQRQDEQDLLQAQSEKWMDKESTDLIKQELSSRKA